MLDEGLNKFRRSRGGKKQNKCKKRKKKNGYQCERRAKTAVNEK